ncbi:MAG: YciI family protein [Actinomycetota bacterium]|nr:YciI family protein [Actinomycetota bacterium]
MRFMATVAMDESFPAGPPPAELFAAIGELGEQGMKDGTLVETGGLLPSASGTRVRVANGTVTVTDGPFTEAKEMVGGYAVYELRSKEEAVEAARRFMQLHADLWPGVEAVCEVRQIAGPDDFPQP